MSDEPDDKRRAYMRDYMAAKRRREREDRERRERELFAEIDTL